MRKIKLISLILAACILFTGMTTPVAGNILDNSKYESKAEDVYILEEDISRRGMFEKHYICSDGTYTAVTYAEAVHYQDENGKWQETDSTLSFDNKKSAYKTEIGEFQASFASSINDKSVVSLKSDGKEISWKITAESLSKTQASVKSEANEKVILRNSSVSINEAYLSKSNIDFNTKKHYISDSSSFVLKNKSSVVEYKNIAGNTNGGLSLRYAVSLNKIEEDIIIEDKSGIADYVMEMDIGELTAQLQSDNSVLLIDKSGEMQYKIGIPFMSDAEYTTSYNITVTIEQNGSSCKITYSPDRDWLNDESRAYPVLLDPTITSREYQCNITDTYVTQADTANHAGEPNMTIGIKSGKLYRAYFRIENLPQLDATSTPTSASITYNHGSGTVSGRTMSLHKVTSAWNASTITYANQPSYNSSAHSSCSFNTTNVSFNLIQAEITSLYNGSNNGYMFKYTSESTTNADYNVVRSMEYPTATERPLFAVSYSYSLPNGLTNGETYVIENAASGKVLNVNSGTNADGTSINQYTRSNSSAQQFKLDYNSATGGYRLRAMCSSSGSGRVVDSTSVSSGGNVRLWSVLSDSKTQDWIIVPVTYSSFKIVSRANPTLALTSYGTSNGTSSGTGTTSSGNVFISAYTGSENQLWNFYYNFYGDWMSVSSNPGLIANGQHYINNLYTGMFVKYSSGDTSGTAFTNSSDSSLKWNFQYLYSNGSSHYYSISTGSSNKLNAAASTILSFPEFPNNVLPDSAKWKVFLSNGKVVIQNLQYGTYLYQSSDSARFTLTSSINSNGKNNWRIVNVNSYVHLTGYTIGSINLSVYETNTVEINATPASSYFKNPSDFTYSIISGNDKVSIVDGYMFKGLKAGGSVIKARHKTTGIEKFFNIFINPCGGASYMYMESHNYNLIEDNCFRCNICSYEVPMPINEDKDILSQQDYLTVISCLQAAGHFMANPDGDLYINPDKLLKTVDDIRTKVEYKNQYSYRKSNGDCVRLYSEPSSSSNPPVIGEYYSINYININSWNIYVYNGIVENLASFILGFKIPPKYMLIYTLFGQPSISTYYSYVSMQMGFPEMGLLCEIIDLGIYNDEMSTGDILITIIDEKNLKGTEVKFLYNNLGTLKYVAYDLFNDNPIGIL
ncbi:RICIN domain-containing protein [Eubacteriales bacterium OttesenSCG-928-G02]|nr:RICIN domain-containing protein [Eubacteriales bacterium OttesenSCG-928-G02]